MGSEGIESRVAFLGGGRMGEALLSGLIRSGGRSAGNLMVTARREERVADLGDRLGVTATLSNPEAVQWARTLVLTVKPQDMEALLEQIAEALTAEHLVISFAAGIRTSFIERFAPKGTPVVRVMSNVPVLVDEAMSVISAGANAEDRHLAVAEELLSSVGKVIRLPEKHQDAITATSGSGPAYFFLLAEAMI
jgi:pyrroline-5-carboxylate reductase